MRQNNADDIWRIASLVAVSINGAAAGAFALADPLKDDSAEAIKRLHAHGIHVYILSGDNAVTVSHIANALGIDRQHAHGNQSPRSKADFIAQLKAQGRSVAMVGDGINDAPALAGATVGIAMGATGSDAAIESADVAFTGHDLGLIPQALRHARRGGRIINQNIVLSLAIITVLLPLAITGVLGLAAVVLVHEVAEVVVIANGLRAARARKQ